MSDFPKAQQPEILHQISKDGEILGDFCSRITKGLELFVKPKTIFEWSDELQLLAGSIYYLGNTLKLKQTLGEEYAYVR